MKKLVRRYLFIRKGNELNFRKMRLTILFSFLIFSGTWANTFSQETKLSLKLVDVSVQEVIREIENKTDFYFLYQDEVFEPGQKVTIDVKNKSLDEVLAELEKQTSVKIEVAEHQIILKAAPALQTSFSQQKTRTITGIVSDVSGEPIPGATVMLAGSTTGTVTDLDGKFHLNIPEGAESLQVSFVGMETQQIAIGKKSEFVVVLESALTDIDEVVVVGYGTQKKENISGSISQVGSEVFEDRATPDIATSLQGAVPNLNINIASGSPNESASYNVRGVESLNDTDPLILVDGVPYDDLDDFSPEDIKSVTVLKDAASAAIYGARAAFGVILVTTKMGTKRSKVKLKYSSSVTLSDLMYIPNSFNSVESATYMNEARTNNGNSAYYSDEFIQYLQNYIDDPETATLVYLDGDEYVTCGNLDVYDEAYADFAVRQQHNLSLSGGGENSTFYASLGYMKDKGQWKVNPDVKDRYNTMFKYTYDVNKWLSTGINVSYNQTSYDEPHVYSGMGSYWHALERSKPWQLINSPEGYEDIGLESGLPMNHTLSYQRNGGRDTDETQQTNVTGNIILKPFKNFEVHTTYTHINTTLQTQDHAKTIYMARYSDADFTGQSASSYIAKTSSQKYEDVLDVYAKYKFDLNASHHFEAMVGYGQTTSDYVYQKIKASDQVKDDNTSVALTTGDVTVTDAENETAIRGIFGRFNYNYNGKYFFEMNARYDGSYVFPEDNRYGFFPSASAAWLISKENFFENVPYVSHLKLRLSYGTLGNQNVDEDLYVSLMDYSTMSGYLIDGEYPTKVSIADLVSDDLTWETSKTKNIGIDLGMFDNRLNVSLDVYQRVTEDMVVDGEELPATLGTDAPQTNAADMETNGFELTVGWKQRFNNGLSFGISASLSDNQSKITKYDLNEEGLLSDYYVGYKFGEIWGYVTEGIFSTDEELAAMEDQSDIKSRTWELGDVNYKDLDGDGYITDGSSTLDDPGDKKIIGNGRARYNYGVTLTAEYKGFDFNCFFRGVGKKDVYFNTGASWYWGHSGITNSQWSTGNHWAYDNAWRADNTDAKLPIYKYNSTYNMKTQTRFLENGAFLRLKSLTLGYTIPKQITQKARLDKVRLYVSGNNLWTHDHLYGLYDPEVLGNSSTTTGKVYPNRRSYAFGIQVSL